MTLGLADVLAGPLSDGSSGTSALVPGLWDAAVNGRTYMIDWKYAGSESFARDSIKLLKNQVDDSGEISQRSLNPEEFAREGQESWHKGAGQTYVDRDDSDPARFRSSKGINPWERWELSLLPATDAKRASANTNVRLQPAGSRLYLIDGADIVYTEDGTVDSPTWTGITGEPATAATSIASDGFNVYTAHGADRVYKTDTSSSSTAAYVTSGNPVSLVGYEKGRLMAAHNNLLYNITATGALPAPLYTHPNSDFDWVAFASGRNVIYCAGYSGDKSIIYKTAVKADGTALDIPTVAGELPDGEIVRAVYGYLGFLCIGTDQGVRFATQDTNGDLTIGALIDLGVSVRCFEGQDRFVWFGWTNYDATSTGLGRLDLSELNGSAPAYASDLMATTQGTVLSVCTFEDRRYFTVSAVGVYGEDSALVASATIDGGLITYGLPDKKVALYVDLRHEPLDGTVAIALAKDGGSFTTLGTSSVADSTSITVPAGESAGETFELRLTLTRDAVTTVGPVVTRTTVEANLAPGRGLFFTLPLLLWDEVELANGSLASMDTAAEEAALIAMQVDGLPITVQTGANTETVLLDDHRFIIEAYSAARDGWNGTFLGRFKRPRSRS